MKSKILALVLILTTFVGLQGCQSPVDSGATRTPDEPSSTVAPVPTLTVTTKPTETPGPTSTVTKTPYPPTPAEQATPDIIHSPVARDLLFSGDKSCRLPCWYGLRISQSRLEDLQRLLKQAVGAPEDYVFRMGENPKSLGVNSGFVEFSWVEKVGGEDQLLTIFTQFNPQINILTNLLVYSTIPSFLDRTRPQRVLKALGTPSAIWVNFQTAERADVASVRVVIVYPDDGSNPGVSLTWLTIIPVQLPPDPKDLSTPRVARWCLAGQSKQMDFSFAFTVPSGFDSESNTPTNYQPIQQVFGITPEALYQRAIQEDDTCLSHEY